jgi:type IV secretion system protein TrbJ
MRRSVISITAAALCAAVPLRATIAVIDYTAIGQLIKSGLTETQQLAQQVQTAENTLNAYTLAAKQATGLGEVAKIWQQYQQTMGQLQGLYGQFSNGGNLQNYLNQFQNVNYWAQVPPGQYNATAAQSWDQNSLTQKQQNDNWAQSIALHQQMLQQNAAQLQRAQSVANSTDSELAAIQSSAQLNAGIANELLEIHALLVQEQQALQARQASVANDDAMKQAASQKALTWTFTPSAPVGW